MLKRNVTLLAAASTMLFVGCRTAQLENSDTKGFGTEGMAIGSTAIDKTVWAVPRATKSGQKYICMYYNDNSKDFKSAKQFTNKGINADVFIKELQNTAQSVSAATLETAGANDVKFDLRRLPNVKSKQPTHFEMKTYDVSKHYGIMAQSFLNDLRLGAKRLTSIQNVKYQEFGFAWYLLGRIDKKQAYNKGLTCAKASNLSASKITPVISSFDEQVEIMKSIHTAMDAPRASSGKSILKWGLTKKNNKAWAFEGTGWGFPKQ